MKTELFRLRAQPLDDGLRERVVRAFEIIISSAGLGREWVDSIENLLRDLRTTPAAQEDTREDLREYDMATEHGAPPILTDHERFGRLERIVVSSANDYAGHCRALHQFHVGDAVEWQGDVGELARELASRKGPE